MQTHAHTHTQAVVSRADPETAPDRFHIVFLLVFLVSLFTIFSSIFVSVSTICFPLAAFDGCLWLPVDRSMPLHFLNHPLATEPRSSVSPLS